MKRSKIFLAAASCCLAVIGIAATKAHKTNVVYKYFDGTQCVSGNITAACTNHSTVFCSSQIVTQLGRGISAAYPIYTTNSACAVRLTTAQQ